LTVSNAVYSVVLKKALIILVIGVFLWPIENVLASCEYSGALEEVVIRSVIDGDTLVLDDGRKVRLLGVNTPELGFGSKVNEPYALAAKAYVKSLWKAKRRAKIAVGHQKKDSYDRVLAHVFFGEINVAEHLLAKGLGFSNARPPDLELSHCYANIATKARHANLAVWSNSSFYSASQSELSGGFTVLSGKLIEVNFSGPSWWLRLDGDAVLLINKASQVYFSESDLRAMLGKKITVQGWLAPRRGKPNSEHAGWILSAYHPLAILNAAK
jgi:endonuclease YncB( thermonuclease family)